MGGRSGDGVGEDGLGCRVMVADDDGNARESAFFSLKSESSDVTDRADHKRYPAK